MAVKIGCGLDDEFFELLKKKFENKNNSQKKAILVLDEIFLRESISVNIRTLTYHGLLEMVFKLINQKSQTMHWY